MQPHAACQQPWWLLDYVHERPCQDTSNSKLPQPMTEDRKQNSPWQGGWPGLDLLSTQVHARSARVYAQAQAVRLSGSHTQ